MVPLFSGLGSPTEVGRDWGVFALLTGAPLLDRVRGDTESTPPPTPPIPNRSPYDGVSESAGALTFVFLYFFISHTH